MADVTFISSLLTTSPYSNIKMFKEGFIPSVYIYTDDKYNLTEEDVIFLYCSDQDTRDPKGETTLAIYFDYDGGDPYSENYYPYSFYQPAFYRGRMETASGEVLDMWEMYENADGDELIMRFLTKIVTNKPEPQFFDFMKYCPKLDVLYRSILKDNHHKDVISFLNGLTYPPTSNTTTETLSSYAIDTGFQVNNEGPSYAIQYMADDASSSNYNYTYVRSYNIYTPSISIPVLLTPFYRAGNYMCCNSDILFSAIYPNSQSGDSSHSFFSGATFGEFYLPEFRIKLHQSYKVATVQKVYGPFPCTLSRGGEFILIIWDRYNNTYDYIKPKYICVYNYGGSNVASMCGSELYGSPLKKIIEIE